MITTNNRTSKILGLLLVAMTICLAAQAQANIKDQYVPGQLTVLMSDGPVYFIRPGDTKWHRVKEHQALKNGDSLRTGNHGYAILAWSTSNILMIKPNSGLGISINPDSIVEVSFKLHTATLMAAARDSGMMQIELNSGIVALNHGEAVVESNSEQEVIKSLMGATSFVRQGQNESEIVHEGYYLDTGDSKRSLVMFDTAVEYHSFRRFSAWLQRFAQLHSRSSVEIGYEIEEVLVNGKFLANMSREENDFYVIETDSGKIPEAIHLQMKLRPYPAPSSRVEVHLGKDLVYVLREGREGFWEVVFPPPSIPEFIMTVHSIDSLGRHIRMLHAGFSVENRQAKIARASKFCTEFSRLINQRSHSKLRDLISRDYRDWQGNTYFDFIKSLEDKMRNYRDVRLNLHPFRYEIIDGKVKVQLNYRLSALTNDQRFRYEDRGSEIFTLNNESGTLRIVSKISGMLFSRMKVAVDLRKGIVKGRITDERTSRPIRGVQVSIRNTSYQTLTDAMGEYVFYNIPPGDYDLRFHKNGYGDMTATKVTVRPSGERF